MRAIIGKTRSSNKDISTGSAFLKRCCCMDQLFALSEATHGNLDQECSVEDTSDACLEYGRFLTELYTLRDSIDDKGPNKKASLADALKMIKLEQPESAKAPTSPELTAALEAAKKATEQHGASSTEARLAWETYEEIASSGIDNAIGINLAEECSIESGSDACRAMEELERVMPVLLAISNN